MKKTELVEIIRTVVKEEIEKSLPQYLMEVLAERLISPKPVVESVQTLTRPVTTQRKTTQVGFEDTPKQSPVVASKIFSNNPILNQVLNETVGGVPLEESVPSAIDALQSLPKEVLSENKEVAAVANALTRDYSKLLKAVDAKAKSKRPA